MAPENQDDDYYLPPDDDSLENPGDHPLNNPYFHGRRAPATTPGAIAVVRRGYEEQDLEGEDEWDPTAPAPLQEQPEFPIRRPARQYIDAAVTPVRKNLHDMSTTRMVIYSIILVAILGGAGAGIAVALTGNDDPAPPPLTFTDICDFSQAPPPNAIVECSCNGNIHRRGATTFLPDTMN